MLCFNLQGRVGRTSPSQEEFKESDYEVNFGSSFGKGDRDEVMVRVWLVLSFAVVMCYMLGLCTVHLKLVGFWCLRC